MRITGIVFACIGLCLLALGSFLFYRQWSFQGKAERATAVVTENRQYTYTGDVNEYGVQHYYCAEFQFRTAAGRSVSFEEPDCAQLDQPPHYQVGQQVEVAFDPADPENTVRMPGDGNSAILAAAGGGAFFALLGAGLFWIGFARGRRQISRI